MKTILISGANGFIATNFMNTFIHKYKFIKLSHKKSNNDHITFEELYTNPKIIQKIDVILNLAGANIGDKKWTSSRKKELLDSRINTTNKLVELAHNHNPQIHFISASAIGIYPTDTECDENTFIDYNGYDNFSQEITRKWENAAHTYQGKLTITRFGVVLSGVNGAFPKMLQPFKMLVGGKIGSGKQYFSWIALPDLLSALSMIIDNHLTGAYNITSPKAIENQKLSQIIAKTWHRPNICQLPAFMIKLIFGQMGNELFLNSLNIIPSKLIDQSFTFEYPDFASCVQAIKAKKF